ncbi:MAG: outer membrane beta-barrel family protein, partial [Bacteroidota bacterium]
SQLGVGYRELPTDTENINQDLNTRRSVISSGEEFRNEQFYNLVIGTDYYIDERNVITLSGNFAYEVEDQPSATTFRQVAADGSTIAEWQREETTEATNPQSQYELHYKRDFKDDKDHDLLLSAIGRFFGKDQSSLFTDRSISGADRDGDQRTRTNFSEAINTFKLDYTRPFGSGFTLETGGQAIINDVTNDFAVSNLENGVFFEDPNLTNVFEYHQDVFGLYGSLAYEGKKWGLKAGVRVENTDLETLLVNTGESNDQNFTNLFPSGFVSYKFTEAVSFQASYSRRIFRPRLWELNPFFNIRNDFNIRVGNPNLLPEFTDSYEFNSIFILGDVSLNFGVYHRFTTEVVERIAFFEDGVTTTTPLNIGTNAATGLELNGKYNVSKILSFNGDVNFNYFSRKGELEGTSFDFNAEQWNAKLTGRCKLPADFEIEATGQYNSSFETVQGEVSGNVWLDFGIRKKLFKGKGAVNFSVRDAFASRFRENFTFQEDFNAYSYRIRGRFITLGFSYGFGKGDTMEYSGQKRRF